MARPAVLIVVLGLGAGLGHPAAQSPTVSTARPAASPVTQVAYLKASNTEAADHFGCGGVVQGHTGQGVAISADGRTLAVGAPHEAGERNSVFDSGAVYVFTRAGDRWAQHAYIRASNPQMSAQFGHAVALSADGGTLAVSAVWEASSTRGIDGNQQDESIPQAGAAYVFTRRGDVWTQQSYIKASNTGEAGTADAFGEGDQFGFSIALNADGNTLAVSALTEDGGVPGINGDQASNAAQSAGAVYVYVRSGNTWTQQAYIKPSNIDAGDLFGIAVSLNDDGDTLAVGSFDEDGSSRAINGANDNRSGGAGAAYVFTRSSSTWSQQAYIKPSNGEAQDSFGVHLALSGDGRTLVVGSLDEDCAAAGVNAPGCDRDAPDDVSMGAAYVFVSSGASWSQQAFLKASNTGFNDWFGARVAISGDGNIAAIAAPFEDAAGSVSASRATEARQDNNTASEAGAIYLFRRSGGVWRQQSYLKGSNTEAFDEFGSSVAFDRAGTTLAATSRGEDSGARGVNGNQNDNSADEAGAAYVFAITN
jgi:hypothetical protein